MQKTGLKERVSPVRKVDRRPVSRSIKRIIEDSQVEPEAYVRCWRAGRGGE